MGFVLGVITVELSNIEAQTSGGSVKSTVDGVMLVGDVLKPAVEAVGATLSFSALVGGVFAPVLPPNIENRMSGSMVTVVPVKPLVVDVDPFIRLQGNLASNTTLAPQSLAHSNLPGFV